MERDPQTSSEKQVTLHPVQLLHTMVFSSMPITNHLKTSSWLLFMIGKSNTEVLIGPAVSIPLCPHGRPSQERKEFFRLDLVN